MGEWIPLMDYAMKKGVSLSTLRRHIKANKVLYRVENGRYLLFVEPGADGSSQVGRQNDEPVARAVASASAMLSSSVNKSTASASPSSPAQANDFLVSQLQAKLKKAQEEIAELKTLIAFYEETLSFGSGSKSAMNRFDG